MSIPAGLGRWAREWALGASRLWPCTEVCREYLKTGNREIRERAWRDALDYCKLIVDKPDQSKPDWIAASASASAVCACNIRDKSDAKQAALSAGEAAAMANDFTLREQAALWSVIDEQFAELGG
jgi:hypothetical protein